MLSSEVIIGRWYGDIYANKIFKLVGWVIEDGMEDQAVLKCEDGKCEFMPRNEFVSCEIFSPNPAVGDVWTDRSQGEDVEIVAVKPETETKKAIIIMFDGVFAFAQDLDSFRRGHYLKTRSPLSPPVTALTAVLRPLEEEL